MNEWVDVLSFLLIALGGSFCIIGGIGLIRMPDFFTRLHAASVIETLGAGFLIFGMLLQSGVSLISIKLLFIALLVFFTSPTATHALARAAVVKGVQYFKKKDGSHTRQRSIYYQGEEYQTGGKIRVLKK